MADDTKTANANPLIDARVKMEALDNEARIERFGWDELTVEQKIERIRRIVKGIEANSREHWRRLEELGQQMRLHVHGDAGTLMPLDTRQPGFGVAEDPVPGGKVYF